MYKKEFTKFLAGILCAVIVIASSGVEQIVYAETVQEISVLEEAEESGMIDAGIDGTQQTIEELKSVEGGVLGNEDEMNHFQEVSENSLTANNSEDASYTLTYKVNEDGTATITGYDGTASHVELVIPQEIDGHVVTSIGSHAFSQCSFTGDLIIPDSVISIGESAFSQCLYFSGDLVIPDSVSYIGSHAFFGCVGFNGNLTISNNMSSIESYTFYNCGFTGDLTIPDSVISIGSYAFWECDFNGNLTIPDSVISIGRSAFAACIFNGNLTIPNSVNSIGGGAFSRCGHFTGDLAIPDSVSSIGNDTFRDCSGFDGKLIIPDSISSIGNSAFENCSGFTGELNIPDNVSSIGDSAFKNCSGFTGKLIIPNNVSSIGSSAFSCCSGFTGDLIIPNSVNSIGGRAFSDCSGFTGNLTLSDNIDGIGAYTFSHCSGFIGNLNIPDSVSSIGTGAFFSCSGFSGSVKVPDGVCKIADYAFSDCQGLNSITIPSAVTTIGTEAFLHCDKLTDIYYGSDESDWAAITIGSGNEPLLNATIHYTKQYRIFIDPGYEIFDKSLEDIINASDTSATVYNPQLAHMLIAMCNSVHSASDMKATFESLEFDQTQRAELSFITFSLGKKQLTDGTTLVLVVVKGTGSIIDDWAGWLSNIVDAGANGDGEHSGFSDAAKEIYNTMKDFLGTEDFSEMKFVITGHSRGAAAANILAKNLVDMNNGADENIYAYTFACPDTAVIAPSKAAKYPTIFNIGNAKDIVTWLPGAVWTKSGESDGWGKGSYWDKYGNSYWFCENWNDYDKRKKISVSMDEHPQDKYLSYLRLENTLTEYKKRKETKDITDLNLLNIIGNVVQISNAVKPNILSIIHIFCPVDIEIYSSDGQLVGKVVNNTISNLATDRVYIHVDDDRKYICLLKEDNYTFKMESTDAGTLEYAVQNVNTNLYEVVEGKTFANINLVTGKQMESYISIDEGNADIENIQLLVLDNEGNAIKEVLPDDNGTEVYISRTITFDGNGGNVEVATVTSGTDGKLSSLPNSTRNDYTFCGWFTHPDGGTQITTDTIFTGDTIIYAHWTPLEEIWGDLSEEDQKLYESPKDIPDNLWIAGIPDNTDYTGKAITFNVRVYDHKKLLTNKTDYTISYKNHTNAADKEQVAAAKAPTMTVKGKGNYSGTIVTYFTINPINISTESPYADEFAVEDVLRAYTGKVQKAASVLKRNGKVLKNGKDYTISYNDTSAAKKVYQDAGTYQVTITGKGNYTGTRVYHETIAAETLMSRVSVTAIKNQKYTGSEITPTLDVKYSKIPLTGMEASEYENASEGERLAVDYTYAFTNNKEVGTASVTLTGVNKYIGTVTKKFKITGTALKDCSLTGFQKTFAYTGGEICQEASFHYSTGKGSSRITYDLVGMSIEEYEKADAGVKAGIDYTYEYTNNIEIGTATVIYKGVNGYTGTIKKNYKITGISMQNVKVEQFTPSFVYTGEELKQDTAKLSYQTGKGANLVVVPLTENQDYVVTYQNNIKAGTATVSYKGIGRYTGTIKRTYKITAYNLKEDADNRITVTYPASAVYAKGGAMPVPVVTYNYKGKSAILTAGTDYTVSYTDHKAVSENSGKTPYIFIQGKGSFSGKRQAGSFTIAKQDLGRLEITVPDITYKKKAGIYKAVPVLTDLNGKKLVSGTDYNKTLAYEYAEDTVVTQLIKKESVSVTRHKGEAVGSGDIIPVGAKIKIMATGKNNYEGTLSAVFRFVEGNLSGARVSVPAQYYTGRALRPGKDQITIKLGKTVLTEADYEIVSYSNNVKKGTAKITLRGVGSYGGTKTVNFKILDRTMGCLVKFDGNGATSGSMNNQTIVSNIIGKPLSENQYKRKGYRFAGWNTEKDGSGISYKNKGRFSNGFHRYGISVTLYAQWEPENFEVSYIPDDGSFELACCTK